MTVDDIARRIKNVSDQLAVEQALGDAQGSGGADLAAAKAAMEAAIERDDIIWRE